MKVDSVVVGAGISGISLARRLAEENGERVLLVERKNHIGGGATTTGMRMAFSEQVMKKCINFYHNIQNGKNTSIEF